MCEKLGRADKLAKGFWSSFTLEDEGFLKKDKTLPFWRLAFGILRKPFFMAIPRPVSWES